MTISTSCSRWLIFNTQGIKPSQGHYKYFIDDVIEYWYNLVSDGLVDSSFHNLHMSSHEDLIELIKNKNNIFVVVIDSRTSSIAGHFFLNNFSGATAHGHFAILKRFHNRKDSFEMARVCIKKMSGYRTETGWLVDGIIGVTPVDNRAAIMFAKKIGFRPLCTIPGICELKDNIHSDGVLSYLDLTVEREKCQRKVGVASRHQQL